MDTSVATQPTKMDVFLGRMLDDMGAAAAGALVLVGDRLGLFTTLAGIGPCDAAGLARAAKTQPRLTSEWLAAMAASGYVTLADGKYSLSPEQQAVFADEQGPAFLAGFFDVAAACWRDEPKLTAAFRADGKLGWHEHDVCLFRGTERFFRTSYRHHLVQEWLPALEGVVARLEAGATVADVGCGHGASTILMAQAFPASRFIGWDYHGASIETARRTAERAGLANTRFEVATAQDFPVEDGGYDLIAFFDCLHDMGDPIGAARRAREVLKPDGTLMVVEPMARDRLEDNLNPVGRIYYAASTLICTPASLSQDGQAGLGAQAGPARLTKVLQDGGFGRVRVAVETPFNIILEARP